MTISTSSSIRRPVLKWLALVALVAGLSVLAWAVWSRGRGQTAGAEVKASDQGSPALLATLQANFDHATRGGDPRQSRMTAMPREKFAGIACNPADLSPESSEFQVLLPESGTNRKGAFAALVPDGSLRIIYISYGIDTDSEDLIIPSRSIEWERARFRNDFIVDARKFDALVPGADRPGRLFQEPGVYQLAMLNSMARDLLDLDKVPFRVLAGCVVNWQP